MKRHHSTTPYKRKPLVGARLEFWPIIIMVGSMVAYRLTCMQKLQEFYIWILRHQERQ